MKRGDLFFIALAAAVVLFGLHAWHESRKDLRGETQIEAGWGDDAFAAPTPRVTLNGRNHAR